jgi:L-glyceraldehyde reductase
MTKLYLVHWPVAFQKGDSYFPLVANSPVEGGDVIIDDGVSIVDTWKGKWLFCTNRRSRRS